MKINIQDVKKLCKKISRDVENSYDGLSLYFIVHHQGKLRETMALCEHEIASHKAGNAARSILRKNTNNGEKSSFLGLAIAQEKKMMGFKRNDHLLGIATLNINDFETIKQLTAHIYFTAWHAIDLFEIRKVPLYNKKFRSGPMIPKRSALNLSKANLQADIFSILMLSLHNDETALKRIGKKRALQTLSPVVDFNAEDYPSVIAVESCEFTLTELKHGNIDKTQFITKSRELSVEIGQTYDEDNIKEWWNFSIPAQDMAWRSFSKEDILSAAINTSDNPFVKSTGLLVSEISGIEPSHPSILDGCYNAFVNADKNVNLHREMVDSLFEEVIQKGVQEHSTRPLLNAANEQNEGLLNGKILGWCASALQEAAAAFERALISGIAPDQAARMQFQNNRDDTSWEDLQKLSNTIIEQKKQGVALTMGHVAEICNNHIAFSPILHSVTVTMKDPVYIQKLEASNDLNVVPKGPAGPEMADPTPSGPTPKSPELSHGPKTPSAPSVPAGPGGMGGGNSNHRARIMYQRHLEAMKKLEESQKDTDKLQD